MVEPEDFGLSPIQTLAHVADPARAPRHTPVWKAWNAGVLGERPRLAPASESDPSDTSADTHFTGVRHCRIGCKLLSPPGRPAAGAVVLHGYSNVPALGEHAERWRALADRGVAVLLVRVRGYPGSRLDCGDWTTTECGYITRGLELPPGEDGIGCEWSFSYAVADAVCAVRALGRFVGASGNGDARGGNGAPPVYLCGESFGGAVAVVAASHLSERDEVSRLAIGLPSMGDWPWRLEHLRPRGAGAGAQIARFMGDHADRADQIAGTLRLFDAALHARRVRCPTLCKLALRDDVVPAPAAAAVFNALSGDPGRKLRFVTKFGHFDGGIADLRRHAAFERLIDEFLDPAQSPEATLAAAESRRA